ncbi:MAG: DUF2281 domain-containing protein [Planctomycetes bacterium]|nr:DUF2281 domain-containing protein [Planctomycetota bacterium]
MTTWELIAQKARTLPPDKQQELLEYAEALRERHRVKRPLRSLAGLWQGFDIAAEDIDEARREMWGRFAPDGV